MRKDALRSLIVWPAIASATITGVCWLSSANSPVWQTAVARAKTAWHNARGPELIEPYLSDQFAWDRPNRSDKASPLPDVIEIVTPVDVPPMIQQDLIVRAPLRVLPEAALAPIVNMTVAEIPERTDQGEAAMKLPERLVESVRVDQQPLFAPRIDELFETAGLDLQSESEHADESFPMEDIFINELAYTRIAIETHAKPDNNAATPELNLTAPVHTKRKTSDSPVIVLLQVINEGNLTTNQPQTPVVDAESKKIFSTQAARKNIAAATQRVTDMAKSVRAKVTALKHLAGSIAEMAPMEQQAAAANKPTKQSIMPQSIANLADLAAKPEEVEESAPSVATIDVAKTAKVAKRNIEDNPATWPLTIRLNEQLDTLAALTLNQTQTPTNQFVSTAKTALLASQWVDQVADQLAQLRSLDRLGNDRAGLLIDQLQALANEGYNQAEQTRDRQQQIEWLRTAYAVSRRVAVWRPVFEVVNADSQDTHLQLDIRPAGAIQTLVQQVRSELPETGDVVGWNRFLMLDEITAAASFDDADDRNVLAKRFLSRQQWHGLDPRHVVWLNRDSVRKLSDAVRPWASEAVDYAALLNQLERREADATARAEREICDAFQTMRFANNANTISVADALNTHYRNANVRVAVTEAMLTRMLPGIETKTMPMRTQVLGSKVRGVSRVSSDLQVDLQPSDDRWSLKLRAIGNVSTQSIGRNGPAVFNTRRDSNFAADTPLEITASDIQVGNSSINVQGSTRLRNVRTNYDGWPLFGTLVRSVAESKYYESSGTSNRIADRKIKTELAGEIQGRLNQRVDLRSGQLEQVVLGPLGSMQLDPLVVDLKTTEERLSARYRLAGDWQLGAFTPRPRAPRSSLMSLQVHESAINNTLERMVPRDQSKAIDQMILDGFTLFGQAEPELPSDLPDDVHVQFAKSHPVTMEIVDGAAWITLRIVRLTRGRMKLSHFIVRAEYRPEIDGLNACLVREGHLRISGPGMSMRERLPVRAIFNKVLSPTRKFALTVPALVNHPKMQDLAISQLELRDGWIGLAISERDAPRVALRPAQ